MSMYIQRRYQLFYFKFIASLLPYERCRKWNDIFYIDLSIGEWSFIHKNNFKCTIVTQLKSFYFKTFHKAIATNDFLYRIKRLDNDLCSFCNQLSESIEHFMVECAVVTPLWKCLEKYLSSKLKRGVQLSTFQRRFGCNKDQDNYVYKLFPSSSSSSLVESASFNFEDSCKLY